MKELYFIALIIPEPQIHSIEAIRTSISNQYDCHHALKSPPHITLHMPFRLEAHRQSELTELLSTIPKPKVFDIQTEDIQCFDQRTIYIDVNDNLEMSNYRYTLQEELFQHLGIGKEKRTIFHPHITLANRDINPVHFKDIVAFAKNSISPMSFAIREVSTLKHNGKNWEIIGVDNA